MVGTIKLIIINLLVFIIKVIIGKLQVVVEEKVIVCNLVMID